MRFRWSSWFFLVTALLVTVSLSPPATAPVRAAQAGSGSVTARVFVCREGLTMTTVLNATDRSALLADCAPASGPVIAPLLRDGEGGTPQPGDLFAEGVYLWNGIPFGSYALADPGFPASFPERLITNGGDEPEQDQEHVEVTINASVPNIERRFYYFQPLELPVGSVALTLYRCPTAIALSPTYCPLLIDPPDHHASLSPDLWEDGIIGVYRNGRAEWHGMPFGIYSIVYSGILEPGEGAAIPGLRCISPDRCAFWIGPRAPSANLALYIFPLPAGAPDSDGDGFTDPHERAGGTDLRDPSSPGPERGRSREDTDKDRLSDQDEAVYGTDPDNPDTDGDGVPDGEEIARGSDPLAAPRAGTPEATPAGAATPGPRGG